MLRRSRSSEPPGHRSGVATSGVVVAGDDPDALELMGRLLTPLGEPVSLIGDTASAVAAVAASPCRVPNTPSEPQSRTSTTGQTNTSNDRWGLRRST